MGAIKKTDDRRNIINSLKYLEREAKISGHHALSSMLTNAILSEEKHNSGEKTHTLANDDDSHLIVELLLRFNEMPKATQRKLVELLEHMEAEEQLLNS